MRIKAFVLSVVVAGGLLAGAGGASNLAAHAAPSAARPAYSPCQTTVLQSVPAYNHVTIHGYVYLMRNLCDGNVFLRVSTDVWWGGVFGNLTSPSSEVYLAAFLPFGGYADTPEIPYISGATYTFDGGANDIWGTMYDGSGSYTAP